MFDLLASEYNILNCTGATTTDTMFVYVHTIIYFHYRSV